MNRNQAIWQPLVSPAHLGISSSLQGQEDTINLLGSHCIANHLLVIDDNLRIKWDQLNSSVQLEYDKIDNEKAKTDMKAANQRLIMALQETTNNYILGVLEYAAEVQRLVMNARETALSMRENEVTLAETRAEYAEEKAVIDVQEIGLKIKLEEINRQYVEIEKLRAQLAVAKAETQVVLAEIDVAKAWVAVANAEVQKAMAEIQKIQIGIDIAMTMADIIQKQIAGVRLEAEKADIDAIGQCIDIKLDAVLDLIEAKIDRIRDKTHSVQQLMGNYAALSAAQIAEQDVRIVEINRLIAAQAFKREVTQAYLGILQDLEQMITDITVSIIGAGTAKSCDVVEHQARSAEAIDDAHEGVYKFSRAHSSTVSHLSQKIIKGFHVSTLEPCG